MATGLDTEDDARLLAAIQSGHHAAFATLVERHSKRFYSIAYRFTANREEAEDIVQQAFIKLWQQPGLWEPKKNAAFTTWFYRVVINLCLDARKHPLSLPLEEDDLIPDENHPAQDTLIATEQTRRYLEASIAALPERQQLALNLCFYEELSNREAAAIMGVGTKALESLLMRAKASLKEKMVKWL